MDVITVSGTDMVGGCKPGGAHRRPERRTRRPRHETADGDIKIENVKREPLAIVALVLAIAVFGFSWVRTRGAMIAAFASVDRVPRRARAGST